MSRKPTPEEGSGGLPGWMATYADMVTLVLTFFVMITMISTVDPVKLQQMSDSMGKSVGKVMKKDNQTMSLADVKKELDKMEKEAPSDPETGEKPLEVKTSPRGVTLQISSDISFESGSAVLKAGIIPTLQKLVPIVNKSYNLVAVEGHTDNYPIPDQFIAQYPSNWDLSGSRASSVVRELIALGVDPHRMMAVGWAEFIPRDHPTDQLIDDEMILRLNASPGLQAKNRRVEITFIATSLD